jgi:hypothetical protein
MKFTAIVALLGFAAYSVSAQTCCTSILVNYANGGGGQLICYVHVNNGVTQSGGIYGEDFGFIVNSG